MFVFMSKCKKKNVKKCLHAIRWPPASPIRSAPPTVITLFSFCYGCHSVTLLKDREHCFRALEPFLIKDTEITHASPHCFSKLLVFGLSWCIYWLNYSIGCVTDAVNGYLVATTVDIDICLLPTSCFKTNISVIQVQQLWQYRVSISQHTRWMMKKK